MYILRNVFIVNDSENTSLLKVFNKNIEQYSSDRAITIALKKGGKKAFRALFDKYHQKIYAVSRKFNISHEDAEGVVQDVFFTLWEKRSHLNEDLSLAAFIMTITKRLVYKVVRSNITRLKHEGDVSHTNSLSANTTEDYIIFSDMKAHVDKQYETLSESKKQIFMLSKEHGLSNDEIAEKLGVSKRTVENQLYRATKMLKEQIGKLK